MCCMCCDTRWGAPAFLQMLLSRRETRSHRGLLVARAARGSGARLARAARRPALLDDKSGGFHRAAAGECRFTTSLFRLASGFATQEGYGLWC